MTTGYVLAFAEIRVEQCRGRAGSNITGLKTLLRRMKCLMAFKCIRIMQMISTVLSSERT